MYRLGFFDLEAGRAAAVAVVMLAVNLTLAWVAGRLIMREADGRCRASAGRRHDDRDARRRRLGFIAALAAAAAAFLLPQLWLFSLSLKSKAGVYEHPPQWLPAGGSLANYRFALTHTQVPWYLWNSAIVAVLATRGDDGGRRSGGMRDLARALPRAAAADGGAAGRADGVAGDPRWCRSTA